MDIAETKVKYTEKPDAFKGGKALMDDDTDDMFSFVDNEQYQTRVEIDDRELRTFIDNEQYTNEQHHTRNNGEDVVTFLDNPQCNNTTLVLHNQNPAENPDENLLLVVDNSAYTMSTAPARSPLVQNKAIPGQTDGILDQTNPPELPPLRPAASQTRSDVYEEIPDDLVQEGIPNQAAVQKSTPQTSIPEAARVATTENSKRRCFCIALPVLVCVILGLVVIIYANPFRHNPSSTLDDLGIENATQPFSSDDEVARPTGKLSYPHRVFGVIHV